MGTWIAPAVRDEVVAFVDRYSTLCELNATVMLRWMQLSSRQFLRWKNRLGQGNFHNAPLPRDHWITAGERDAIIAFARQNPLDGYRNLTYMMLDQNAAAVSAATVYRVLKTVGIIGNRPIVASKKGTGFVQPLAPHEHWHVDFSYINVAGTYYFWFGALDGCSRMVVAWDIRESMKVADAQIVLQRGRETFPHARPRIISDNGAQFVAKEFKAFVRQWQTSHVFTSPNYPQSNGKIERFHRTLKEQAIRPMSPLTLDDARRVVGRFVDHYNYVRLHSAIGYITPADKLAGRDELIWTERKLKLENARELRAKYRKNNDVL